jgi:hypothetical protein
MLVSQKLSPKHLPLRAPIYSGAPEGKLLPREAKRRSTIEKNVRSLCSTSFNFTNTNLMTSRFQVLDEGHTIPENAIPGIFYILIPFYTYIKVKIQDLNLVKELMTRGVVPQNWQDLHSNIRGKISEATAKLPTNFLQYQRGN